MKTIRTVQLYARRLLVVGAVALTLGLLGPEDIAQGLAAVAIVIGLITVASLPARPVRWPWQRRRRATPARCRTRGRAR